MGYRGKLEERAQARDLRAQGWTMADIAVRLGVARSSVSLWTRDVPFTPDPDPHARAKDSSPPARSQRAPAAQAGGIDQLLAEGAERIGHLSEREFLVAGAALYAGEGSKRDGMVALANTDSGLTAIPPAQFAKPYRAVPDKGIRHSMHLLGCITVRYTCVRTHRAVMGLVHALLAAPGVVRWDEGLLGAILQDRLPG